MPHEQEEAIKPIEVKKFRKTLYPRHIPGIGNQPGAIVLFQEELARTDCHHTADGLFFQMAQVIGLPWEETFQRLRIYIAYAKAGNRQALVCLTHHLLEKLKSGYTDMFWRGECPKLAEKTIEELLDFLRDSIEDIDVEPNRRIVGEFLVRLFKEERSFQARIIEILIMGEYPINLRVLSYYPSDDAPDALRELVNTEKNQAFIAEIDAAFSKRLETEKYCQSLRWRDSEAKFAIYFLLWELGRAKKERKQEELATGRGEHDHR